MARLEHGGVDLAHGVMHCAPHPYQYHTPYIALYQYQYQYQYHTLPCIALYQHQYIPKYTNI